MEKINKQIGFPPIVFALVGLALIFTAYGLAGGQNRRLPTYGFPEPAFDCDPVYGAGRPNQPPPQLSRGYSQSELLWCYPRQDYPLYALAIVGVVMCGWALGLSGKKFFQRERGIKAGFLHGMGVLILSPLMLLIGVRMLKLEFSAVCCTTPGPPDIFNILSAALVITGLFVIIVVIVSILVAEFRGSSIG